METREKKLQVKDLTISFKTINGKLQAVRDISFDLYKGETLAIVGESGSGKSATSKTILGISAANTIVESGEILYDGKDLLKISEEDYHEIRGDKISMVFQDPLSSLNPIMRIGNQITEAMILKNKANRRESRKKLNVLLKKLEEAISKNEKINETVQFKTFKAIISAQASYQAPYEQAFSNAQAGLKALEDMVLGLEKKAIADPYTDAKELAIYLKASINHFVVKEAEEMKSLVKQLLKATGKANFKKDGIEPVNKILANAKVLLEKAVKEEVPDFFALGCYLVLSNNELDKTLTSSQLNKITIPYKQADFMKSLEKAVEASLEFSSDNSVENMKKAVSVLKKQSAEIAKAMPDKKAVALKLAQEISDSVEKAIDPFETVKDSYAYTFRVSLTSAVKTYYEDIERNILEQKRFDKQTAKYQRAVNRGKKLEHSVAPLSLSDLSIVQANIVQILDSMKAQFESRIDVVKNFDYAKRTEIFLEYLKTTAMNSILVVTKSMAKDRAIRVMEQVGITEARKRYRQYPFEFSGGMRQRIVIAIALTANPDILICDEPTTALDVTIQAQILELINKLKKERNLSVIFITHDLGVVANMADRIAVMYAGKIVEYGTSDEVFYHPAHPYTWALLASIPDLNSTGNKLESIPGTPPNMIYPPKGDAFAARNKYAMEIDFEEQPPMFKISDTHYAATWLLHPNAPVVEMPEIVKERIARMNPDGGTQNGR